MKKKVSFLLMLSMILLITNISSAVEERRLISYYPSPLGAYSVLYVGQGTALREQPALTPPTPPNTTTLMRIGVTDVTVPLGDVYTPSIVEINGIIALPADDLGPLAGGAVVGLYSAGDIGIFAGSQDRIAIIGRSGGIDDFGIGVLGDAKTGVVGRGTPQGGMPTETPVIGVSGTANRTGGGGSIGVMAEGVNPKSGQQNAEDGEGIGLLANGSTYGVRATALDTMGREGAPVNKYGVYGEASPVNQTNSRAYGVYGDSLGSWGAQFYGYGVYGSSNCYGVYGESNNYGVYGIVSVDDGNGIATGVYGEGYYGVEGKNVPSLADPTNPTYAIYGHVVNRDDSKQYAGYFEGRVHTGILNITVVDNESSIVSPVIGDLICVRSGGSYILKIRDGDAWHNIP